MPIYEFICRDCRIGFEKLISASRRDQVACPSCGSPRTATHISLTAPAQTKGAARSTPQPMDCGAPGGCCGGGCGMPGMN